ncbi:g11755 [Coccomyxa viridis]|uniref:G11755 protein n=1 Tax=Coccomyxa viridis TaxID=1274662 RepID=A0ABP1GDD8_9CHLO
MLDMCRQLPNPRAQDIHLRWLHVVSAGGPSGGLQKTKRVGGGQVDTPVRKLLLGIAVTYTALIVILPFLNVFYQAFGNGFGPFLEHLQDEDFLHAVKMTLLLAVFSVPINTVWGIIAAIQITRNEFWGKTFVMSMLDLPFSISPVVTGLMLVLLYGREGWFSPVLRAAGFNVVFAFPGMALATLFVTLPFVVRELIPILEAMDMSEEEAARTLGANDWQVFWNVTLPNIRWGLLYGLILTNARAMGEFGAVSVISGNIIGKTQTLTLYVESAYKEYNTEAAFSAAVLLSFLALITLVIKEIVERASTAE